jgi:transcriptional regulator with XRE-family HTH domain
MGFMVKEVRESKGMTQEELEIKSGVSRQTISAIENNKCGDVKTGTLVAIARALGTTLDAIFFPGTV